LFAVSVYATLTFGKVQVAVSITSVPGVAGVVVVSVESTVFSAVGVHVLPRLPLLHDTPVFLNNL